ncbi:hypothetical protein OGR47_04375 [Methylocystis sp. MJC1]|uniref:hypothetical protein n=1 Tax=Methylocystis sp. MJC1 TaxID=2654282 RepID=UPI001FF06F40|nr:hypothetical protein [Methylocystis sp. MJC1]KAF2991209.1 hypothetical protein MJC1_01558 [Methylocystis sp. MJC1]UZX12704.1 hypothetical protein OGR47_04375 [Methylocystis sp. MJC1]
MKPLEQAEDGEFSSVRFVLTDTWTRRSLFAGDLTRRHIPRWSAFATPDWSSFP